MPEETRYYAPKLQAVKNIVADPQAFGLVLPPLANHPVLPGVPIERDIDVVVAVRLSGVSMDEFKTLNPQMNKPVILPPARCGSCCPTTTPTASCTNSPCTRADGHVDGWLAPGTPARPRRREVA